MDGGCLCKSDKEGDGDKEAKWPNCSPSTKKESVVTEKPDNCNDEDEDCGEGGQWQARRSNRHRNKNTN